MKFNNTRVMNFEGALRGMRNPKESYHLSDSFFGLIDYEYTEADYDMASVWAENEKPEYYDSLGDYEEERIALEDKYDKWLLDNGVLYRNNDDMIAEVAFIGPKDLELAQRLIKAGPEHRKFMRQIIVSVDITAPLYWWKEFDTYKVGTVANSTSTMHKLTAKPITFDCFEIDDYVDNLDWTGVPIGENVNCYDSKKTILRLIDMLEGLRQKYLDTKDERYWKELIRWLPESWLQTRTVTMSYENLFAMCSKGQRRFHKLNEWSGIHTKVDEFFIQWARTLPYAGELLFLDELIDKNNN
jgi:hypothetical protein